MEARPLTEAVQTAIRALNEIIISDELNDTKVVLKISRFKKWLKDTTEKKTEPEDTEDLGLSDNTEPEQGNTESKQPTVINFK